MAHKNKMETFFACLFYSWSGDTPAETIWAANDLIDALIELFGIEITDRFDLEGVTTEGNTWKQLGEEIHAKLSTCCKPKG